MKNPIRRSDEFIRYPLIDECNVLVCGGGPSGFTAAISAARNGAKTILVERYGFPGGMMTAGYVNPIYGFFSRHIQVVRGIGHEFINELIKIKGATSGYTYRHECIEKRRKSGECVSGEDEKYCPVACVSKVCAVDSEISRIVIAEMLIDANVKAIYHSNVIAVRKTDHRIREILISNKSGFQRIRSEIIIDATGDADIAALAGGDYVIGDDGILKPPTLMFKISGVNSEKDRIKIDLPDAGKEIPSGVLLMALTARGEYTVNSPSGIINFNSTDSIKLSYSQVYATRKVLDLFSWLKSNIDFLSGIILTGIAPQLGIRDSRRIHGIYTLTEEDVLGCRKFPESGIANAVHPIDLHVKTEKSGRDNLILFPCGDYYQIPYETMVPKKIDNLIVTGRSVSSTFTAQGSLRVMATCMMLGESAGIAGALCSKNNIFPKNLNPLLIKKILIANGAYLGEENNIPAWNQGKAELPQEIAYQAY
jgi:hypothetical protein